MKLPRKGHSQETQSSRGKKKTKKKRKDEEQIRPTTDIDKQAPMLRNIPRMQPPLSPRPDSSSCSQRGKQSYQP